MGWPCVTQLGGGHSLASPAPGFPAHPSGPSTALRGDPEASAQTARRVRELESEIEQMRAASSQLEVYAADLQQTYGELRRRLSQMQALHRLTIRVSSQLEPDDVLNEVLAGLGPLVPHEIAAAYLRSSDGLFAIRRFVAGEAGPDLPEQAQLTDGLIGQAMTSDDPCLPSLGRR